MRRGAVAVGLTVILLKALITGVKGFDGILLVFVDDIPDS